MIWENEYIINNSYVRLQKKCFFFNVIADAYDMTEHDPPRSDVYFLRGF